MKGITFLKHLIFLKFGFYFGFFELQNKKLK